METLDQWQAAIAQSPRARSRLDQLLSDLESSDPDLHKAVLGALENPEVGPAQLMRAFDAIGAEHIKLNQIKHWRSTRGIRR